MATASSMTPVAVEESLQSRPLHEDIAALAFALWQERGCPEGSPEVDWFRAEEELKTAS
jgi:hypothetical protein